MTDFRLSIAADGSGADMVFEGGDLVRDPCLTTSVLIALFSDARIDEEQAAQLGESDPRGWWAEEAGEPFGSRLWTLDRSKQTPNALARAEEYAREALAPLVAEGIVESVEVQASFPVPGRLRLDVLLHRGRSPRWESLWDAMDDETFELPGTTLRLLPA